MKFAGILGVNAQHTHTRRFKCEFLDEYSTICMIEDYVNIYIVRSLLNAFFFFSLLFCRFNLVLVYCCCCAVGDCKSMTNVRWSSCLCKQTGQCKLGYLDVGPVCFQIIQGEFWQLWIVLVLEFLFLENNINRTSRVQNF